MAEAVCALRHAFAALPAHDELGPSTITFGQIEGGYRPYVVPDRAKVWIDMRLTPPTGYGRRDAGGRAGHRRRRSRRSRLPWQLHCTGDRPAIERDPNSPLLAAAQACRR